MAEQGSRQVQIHGRDNQCEITALLTVALSGRLLQAQLIYPGKTARRHPQQTFPNPWDVYHTTNQGSNKECMVHFVEENVAPYIKATRERLVLQPDWYESN